MYHLINDRYGDPEEYSTKDEFEADMFFYYRETLKYSHTDIAGNIYYIGPEGPEITLEAI